MTFKGKIHVLKGLYSSHKVRGHACKSKNSFETREGISYVASLEVVDPSILASQKVMMQENSVRGKIHSQQN